MTQQHPDLADEQAYIDHAYECLETSRTDAWKLRNIHEGTLGGTVQARYERDVFDETLVNRLTQLDLGDASLVFGRIDRPAEAGAAKPGAADSDPSSYSFSVSPRMTMPAMIRPQPTPCSSVRCSPK